MSEVDTDAALFARMRRRDGAAFRDVVARHHPRQLRLASACTADGATADALARASWESCIQCVEHAPIVSTLAVWLTQRFLETVREHHWAAACVESRDSITGARLPIGAAIRQLPELDRWVVVLHDGEHWPARDVRECLLLTDGEYRQHLHSGRSTLTER